MTPKKKARGPKPKGKPTSVRVHWLIHHEFKVRVQKLAISPVMINDRKPIMENVTEALYIWFTGLGTKEAEDFLARFAPKIEEVYRHEPTGHDEPRGGGAEMARQVDGRRKPGGPG